MTDSHQKPLITKTQSVAKSRLFTIEQVDLTFSNGQKRIYERMKPNNRKAVMIIPVLGDDLLLIEEYAVAIEEYELGFPKGAVEPGEEIFAAANRELMEEIGYGANKLTLLTQLSTMPSYFANRIAIVLAEDLYPKKLEGDEPETLTLVKWPMAKMMELLDQACFHETRNVSSLFLAREHFLKHDMLPK